MKILVIAGFGIGDLITTTPLLCNLKKISDAQVFLFSEKPPSKNRDGKHLLSDCPFIDGYVTLERITEHHLFKKVTNFSRLLKNIRKEHFDVVIDSWPSTKKTALLSYFSGAKRRLGYQNNPYAFLYTEVIDAQNLPKPLADAQFLPFLGVSISKKELYTQVFVSYKEHVPQMQELLARKGRNQKIIACNVGRDGDFGRQWIFHSWVILGRWLEKEYNAKLVFLGDSASTQSAAYIQRRLAKKHVDVVGKLSFEESIALLSQCDLLISINNGLMHMASVVNIPIIALSGYSLPGWDVYASKTISFRKKPVQECIALTERCRKKGIPCDEYCMGLITPDDVKKAVKKLLR